MIVSDDDDTERYVRELDQRVDDEPEPRHPSLGGISIPDGDELAAELEAKRGVKASPASLSRLLCRAGFTYNKRRCSGVMLQLSPSGCKGAACG